MLRRLAALSVFAVTLVAQERVAPENMYPRVLCVVPLVGTGTQADPIRPMFVPAPPTAAQLAQANAAVAANPGAPPPSRIIAFQYQLSDDGKFALVELVGSDRNALAPILNSIDARVQAFDLAKTPITSVETAFRVFKKNFTMSKFVPVRAQ